MASASRAYTFATPVAITRLVVAPSRSDALENASRLVDSGTHSAPNPSASTSLASCPACFAGSTSSAAVQIPNRPTSIGALTGSQCRRALDVSVVLFCFQLGQGLRGHPERLQDRRRAAVHGGLQQYL